MTEEEAKTKVCVHQPFERTTHFASRDGQAVGVKGYFEPKCLGSQCMAWRWNTEAPLQYLEGGGYPVRATTPYNRTGYCGLAGKP